MAIMLVVDIFELTVLVIFEGKLSPIAVKLLTGPPVVAGFHDILKLPLLTIPVMSVGG
jgi:hypothetical protein